MNDEQNTSVSENTTEATPASAPVSPATPASRAPGNAPRGRRPVRGGAGGERRPSRGGDRKREPRERAEFDQRTILIRRVARVMAGGRRFSFSAAIAAGDRKGRVGIGIGKGGDTALAIEKALRDAKKNMITVRLTKTMSIAHDVMAKTSSGIVAIRPSPERGIVAGSAVKIVLELAGIKDVTAKVLSPSKNKLNIARATIKALSSLKK